MLINVDTAMYIIRFTGIMNEKEQRFSMPSQSLFIRK